MKIILSSLLALSLLMGATSAAFAKGSKGGSGRSHSTSSHKRSTSSGKHRSSSGSHRSSTRAPKGNVPSNQN